MSSKSRQFLLINKKMMRDMAMDLISDLLEQNVLYVTQG